MRYSRPELRLLSPESTKIPDSSTPIGSNKQLYFLKNGSLFMQGLQEYRFFRIQYQIQIP